MLTAGEASRDYDFNFYSMDTVGASVVGYCVLFFNQRNPFTHTHTDCRLAIYILIYISVDSTVVVWFGIGGDVLDFFTLFCSDHAGISHPVRTQFSYFFCVNLLLL